MRRIVPSGAWALKNCGPRAARARPHEARISRRLVFVGVPEAGQPWWAGAGTHRMALSPSADGYACLTPVMARSDPRARPGRARIVPPAPRGQGELYRCAATDQPDIDAGFAAIREVVATLEAKPGVYRMLDARGDVLYVGKARALKNRVANYTAGRSSAAAAQAHGQPDAVDDHRHDQFARPRRCCSKRS